MSDDQPLRHVEARRRRFRLPQGPWFPWSREFRGPPTRATASVGPRYDHAIVNDLLVLVDAVRATIGPVVEPLGLRFRPAATQPDQGAATPAFSLLYEGSPEVVRRAAPALVTEGDPCIDLWVQWVPASGSLDVDLAGWGFPRSPDGATPELLAAATAPATDAESLRAALDAYATALAGWLSRQG